MRTTVQQLPGVRDTADVIALSPLTGSELGHLTLQAGLRVLGVLEEAARGAGLQASDLRAMYLLHVHGPHSAGALAAQLLMPQSCVTLIATRLSGRGLLTRTRDRADGRRVVLALTGAGTQVMDETAVDVRSGLKALFAPLSPGASTALAALLADVVEAVPSDPAPA